MILQVLHMSMGVMQSRCSWILPKKEWKEALIDEKVFPCTETTMSPAQKGSRRDAW